MVDIFYLDTSNVSCTTLNTSGLHCSKSKSLQRLRYDAYCMIQIALCMLQVHRCINILHTFMSSLFFKLWIIYEASSGIYPFWNILLVSFFMYAKRSDLWIHLLVLPLSVRKTVSYVRFILCVFVVCFIECLATGISFNTWIHSLLIYL